VNVSTAPTFTQKISTGPVTVLAGSTETINFSLTDTGIDFSNGIADLEIYDSTGKKVLDRAKLDYWTASQLHLRLVGSCNAWHVQRRLRRLR
jgi:hypothetical protein